MQAQITSRKLLLLKHTSFQTVARFRYRHPAEVWTLELESETKILRPRYQRGPAARHGQQGDQAFRPFDSALCFLLEFDARACLKVAHKGSSVMMIQKTEPPTCRNAHTGHQVAAHLKLRVLSIQVQVKQSLSELVQSNAMYFSFTFA